MRNVPAKAYIEVASTDHKRLWSGGNGAAGSGFVIPACSSQINTYNAKKK
jgi:hypothetical protein